MTRMDDETDDDTFADDDAFDLMIYPELAQPVGRGTQSPGGGCLGMIFILLMPWGLLAILIGKPL